MSFKLLIYFDSPHLLIGIGILCILLPIAWRRKHNGSYLLLLSIFWIYLLGVVSVVIFPIPIHTNPSDFRVPPSMNLTPFYFGSCFQLVNLCIRSILENILLTIPFGFGVNFLFRVKPQRVLWLALAVGFVFESSQLLLSLMLGSGFRATDINDVILNSVGVFIGYGLFRLFAWLYLKITVYFKPRFLLAYIYEVALQAQPADRSKKDNAARL